MFSVQNTKEHDFNTFINPKPKMTQKNGARDIIEGRGDRSMYVH